MVNLASFKQPKAFGETVLPDRSILIGQKIGGKCQNSNTTSQLLDKLWTFGTLCLESF